MSNESGPFSKIKNLFDVKRQSSRTHSESVISKVPPEKTLVLNSEQQDGQTEKVPLPGLPYKEALARKEFPDLDTQYKDLRYLGAGDNDFAHLVQDAEGRMFVALVPKKAEDRNWLNTLAKFANAEILADLGLGRYLVKMMDVGMITLDNRKRRAVITEYAGQDITTLESDTDKIEALKQIRQVLEILHKAGQGIKDFKTDHWFVQKNLDQSIQVKLIDYTNVGDAAEKIHENGKGKSFEQRHFDFGSLKMLVNELFPWFKTEKYNDKATIEESEQVYAQMLRDLEEQMLQSGKLKKELLGTFWAIRRKYQ